MTNLMTGYKDSHPVINLDGDFRQNMQFPIFIKVFVLKRHILHANSWWQALQWQSEDSFQTRLAFVFQWFIMMRRSAYTAVVMIVWMMMFIGLTETSSQKCSWTDDVCPGMSICCELLDDIGIGNDVILNCGNIPVTNIGCKSQVENVNPHNSKCTHLSCTLFVLKSNNLTKAETL